VDAIFVGSLLRCTDIAPYSVKGDLAMFEKLMAQLKNANSPFKGFLGELWQIWSRDAGRAVLLARWYWEKLPEELAQQAAVIQRQAQANQAQGQINELVNHQMGMMGIFPGSGGGPSFGFGMNPDHAMFIMIMGLIRAHRGEPPVTEGMAQNSDAVFRGQMDPVDALIASVPPFARQQVIAAAQIMKMTGMYQLLKLQAIIQAASSLSRDQIPVHLPEVEHA
jgi:hypothetical protein